MSNQPIVEFPMGSDEELKLRHDIQKLVVQYYEKVHKPKNSADFKPGNFIPYAGRIFDSEEMTNLVDSSLDFWLTSGRFTEQFEESFAKKLRVRYALTTNSGSSANLLAFTALTSPLLKDRQVLPGDEVITVAAGFPTTINPVLQYGAVPVFVDVTINDGTYNIDTSLLEAALTKKTKAIMIAHTLGNPFRLDIVKEFCDKHQLWLIEDNCDALGSTFNGKWTGTFGDVATSSFYPPHHMTMGEGGAVYTNNPLIKRAAESYRDWGRDCWCPSGKDNTCKKRFGWTLGELPTGYDHKYIYRHFGYNLKITDMQASVGCAQLKKLDHFTKRRRENWAFLRESLNSLSDRLIMPEPTPGSEPSWFGFLMTVRDSTSLSRNELCKFLESKKIQTRMLFAGNFLRHPAFDSIRGSDKYRVVGELKNTDKIMNDTFWIGVYPGLRLEHLQYVCEQVKEFVG